MARTDGTLNPGEVIAVEELDGIANNSVIYKDNSGQFQEVPLGAVGTVFKSTGTNAAPEFGATAGTGDVIGPVSSTDNAIARYDSTTGKVIQSSGATIDDAGNVSATNLSGTNTGDQDLSGYQLTSEKGVVNGYASLDAGGKIPEAQLPSIVISEYLGDFIDLATALLNAGVQASQRGDWFTVQTNGGESYIVISDNPTVVGDVRILSTPTGDVSSVFGRTGIITSQSGDYEDGQITASASATNYTPTEATVGGHLSGIDTALGSVGVSWGTVIDGTATSSDGITANNIQNNFSGFKSTVSLGASAMGFEVENSLGSGLIATAIGSSSTGVEITDSSSSNKYSTSLKINQKNSDGFVINVQDGNVSSRPLLIRDNGTLTSAIQFAEINTGSDIQAHKGLVINAKGAHADQRGILIDTGTGTGIGLELIGANNAIKFPDGTTQTTAAVGGGGAVTTLYGDTIGDILPSTETTIASFIAGQSGTLTSVRVDLDIAPTGSSATVDVYKNGSSIGIVTITAASTSGSQGTFSDTAVVAGAKYEFKATGGTTVRGGGSTYINFIIS